jgi:hypothetical protein
LQYLARKIDFALDFSRRRSRITKFHSPIQSLLDALNRVVCGSLPVVENSAKF